jgi:hypothetical protein
VAIDNAEKRKNVAAIGYWLFGPGVTPNSSKDAEWRQQAGWGYSGIAASVITAVVDTWTLRKRDLNWSLAERELAWNLRKRDLNWTLDDDPR